MKTVIKPKVTFEVEVANIKYETDGQSVKLPTKGIFQVDRDWYISDPDDAVADAISKQTGFLVKSCRIVG